MKKFLAALLIVFSLLITNSSLQIAFAAASDELDAAEIRLVCAICSMGAYSDDESYLMRSALSRRQGLSGEQGRRKNFDNRGHREP